MLLYLAIVEITSRIPQGMRSSHLLVRKYLMRKKHDQIPRLMPMMLPYTKVHSRIGWKQSASRKIAINSMLFLLKSSLVIFASPRYAAPTASTLMT